MTSPALGIAYSFWLRLRWAVPAIAIYLAALSIVVRLVPTGSTLAFLTAALSIVLLSFVLLYLLNVFSFGPASLESTTSGFPSYMLALPVSTWALVGWPVAIGTAAMASMWLLVATQVLIPSGLSIPLIWPAALLATCTAWLQVVSWSSFPSSFARVPLLAVVLTPVFALSLVIAGPGSPWGVWLTIVALIAWTLAAYGFGVRALENVRNGSEPSRIWARAAGLDGVASIADMLSARGRPAAPLFRSAINAQLWLEVRRNASFLPITLALYGIPLLFALCSGIGGRNAGLLFAGQVWSPTAIAIAAWIGLPLLASATTGTGMGKFDFWGKYEMPPFFAVRPLNTQEFVGIKFLAALIAAVASLLIVLAVVAVWGCFEASPLNPRPSMVRLTPEQATCRDWAVAAWAVCLYTAVLWRNVVVGFWPALVGRKWVVNAIGFGSLLLISLGVAAGGYVYSHPEVRPALFEYAPWLLAGTLTAKLGAAAYVSFALVQRQLIAPRTRAIVILCWAAVTALVIAMCSWILAPSALLAAIVVQVVPITRLLAAPLALEFNRHR